MRERKYKSTTYEAVMERVNRGMNFKAIALELGCNPHHLRSAGSVLGIRSAYRGRTPTTGKYTESARMERKIAKAKKNADRFAIIAESVKAGEPLEKLAERLGVTKGVACRYRQVYVAMQPA
ncbi:MAG: hypothetical protein ACRC1H_09230 [Caldilineaceae bacterium]